MCHCLFSKPSLLIPELSFEKGTKMNSQNSNPSSFRKQLKISLLAGTAFVLAATGVSQMYSVNASAEAVRVESGQQPGFGDVVAKVTPAVVSVRVKGALQPAGDMGDTPPGMEDLPKDHPLYKFFHDFQNRGPGGQEGGRKPHGERMSAQGSGFFISEDGYLVTNNHVVDQGEAFTVVLNDGTEMDAKLIGKDSRTDLAVLKVEPSRKFTYVAFADDSKVRVGDWVVAVGNPFGLGGTVTAGIISANGRDIGAGPYDNFLQIDAAVNHGNSGGPAFNLNGEVVGINTAIFSPSGGNVGIAFAIPASTATEVVDKLMHGGKINRGWLGVQIQPVNADIAESLGLKEAKGALVNDPQEGGPAAKAGIKAGDVILAINGVPVDSPKDLARKVAEIPAGTKTDFSVWRNGKAETISIGIEKLNDADQKAEVKPAATEKQSLTALGMTVAPNDNGDGIVVTDVDPDSAAADRGVSAGDVIVSVNSTPVKTPDDVNAAIASAEKSGRKAVLMQIDAEKGSRFVAFPVAKG
jgi:serine protease Do